MLYEVITELMPERFGRVRKYALGKTSGKANILKNLEELGIDLSAEEMKKVSERVIELSDKKEMVTTEDLPYIIADVLRSSENLRDYIKLIVITSYSIHYTKLYDGRNGWSILTRSCCRKRR